MKVIYALLFSCLIAAAFATVYFEDDFSDKDFESRWVTSNFKKDEGTAGEWDLSAGEYFDDEENEKGLHTTTDARFYAISSKFDEFANKDKDLVMQFTVKHQQDLDCGGGYFKLMPAGTDLENFNGDTEYNVMFGPDICGYGHRIVHFILNKNGENRLLQKKVDAPHNVFTHTYTGVLKTDNTYAIYIDGEEAQSGNIEDDWDILEPKTINDPEQSKPEGWVDAAMIDDPEDVKPADWVEEPMVVDTEAVKPDDWDDELDGEWEAPKVPNPEYKGPWSANRIENPDYKGPWEHPQVANPDYKSDSTLYSFDSHGAIGIEIWQVKAGSIFSNFLLTDDLDLALEKAKKINAVRAIEEEKKAKVDEAAKAEQEAARKAAEEAAAATEDEEEKNDL